MKPAAQAVLPAYQTRFEGRLNCMYCDQKNLVTTGVGHLLDGSPEHSPEPWLPALRAPWLHSDGSLASRVEVIAEWKNIKHLVDTHPGLPKMGGGAYRHFATLHLSEIAIDTLVDSDAAGMEAYLRKRFVDYDSWPADAQLGILSMSWPMGPMFYLKYPHFSAAADRLDFAVCAEESAIHGAWYDARNKAHHLCFTNAAAVLADTATYSPDALYWPRDLTVAA